MASAVRLLEDVSLTTLQDTGGPSRLARGMLLVASSARARRLAARYVRDIIIGAIIVLALAPDRLRARWVALGSVAAIAQAVHA